MDATGLVSLDLRSRHRLNRYKRGSMVLVQGRVSGRGPTRMRRSQRRRRRAWGAPTPCAMVLEALIGLTWRYGLDGHGGPRLIFGESEAENLT